MKNSDNKTDLFKLIALSLAEKVQIPTEKQFFCSINENVLSLPESLPKSNLTPCSHKEVDMRILLHAKDCVENGF